MALRGKEMLLVEKMREEGIMIITINRPERNNRFTTELFELLGDAWDDFKADNDMIVAILTATGDTFITGPDLEDIGKEERGEVPGMKVSRFIRPFYPREIWKPVICALNGDAFCGGFMLAGECDIRIAADHAMFGIAEAQWSLYAPWLGGLTRQFSLGQAYELALWGDGKYTAQRMYEMGWINRVVPKGKVMEEAMLWARRMQGLSPRVVRNFKEIIWRAYSQTIAESRAFAMALEQNLWMHEENNLEGARALMEGRKPRYKKVGREPYSHGKDTWPKDLVWKK